MASVASTAARKCRTLVFTTQLSPMTKGASLSILRQHLAAALEESNHFGDDASSKRSFYSMHEQGRRTKSTTAATKNGVSSNTSKDSDLVVVLDLDECLIHTKFLKGGGQHNQYAFQVSQQQQQQQQQESIWSFSSCQDQQPPQDSSLVDTFHVALPDGDLAKVHQRPFLEHFLQAVSSKYETHLFTAGKQVYAKSVLQHLDPQGSIFAKCLSRDDCTYDPLMKAYVKDLDRHFENVHKTVLVDNNHLSFLANPQNGILVANFFDDPNDTTLLAVLDLLEELEDEEDVRPVLEARFGLTDFLQRRQQHQEAKYEQEQQKKKQKEKILESTEQLMINASV